MTDQLEVKMTKCRQHIKEAQHHLKEARKCFKLGEPVYTKIILDDLGLVGGYVGDIYTAVTDDLDRLIKENTEAKKKR